MTLPPDETPSAIAETRARSNARGRLVRRGLLVAAMSLVALFFGIWWVLVVFLDALAVFAIHYDHRHRADRGGWKTAPVSSFDAAMRRDPNPTFVINERSSISVDRTGRTFAAGKPKEPTPGVRAAIRGSFWDSLGGLVVLALFLAILVGLAFWYSPAP